MSLVLANSTGTYLNDSRRVVGYTSANKAFRHTPGVGTKVLGSLGQRTINWAFSINSAGDVVGTAAFANGNGDVPFLYTDAGGMQAIGNFSGSAHGIDINDLVEVIGMYDPITQPWIWSPSRGLRFLDVLLEPSANLSLTSIARINKYGQIVGYGTDNVTGQRRPVLLTPSNGETAAYCTAGVTTNGCTASISGVGVPSASRSSGFLVRVDGMDGQKLGLVFYGVSGPASIPWGSSSSFLCVQAPLQRTGAQVSGGTTGECNGAMMLDWNSYVESNPNTLGQPFVAGVTVWAQGWFRDAPSPQGTHMSNGLRFTLSP